MYVVKFILNFTSHLNSEQLIPNCGENEFYYKYTIHIEKLNTYYYLYSMLMISIIFMLTSVTLGFFAVCSFFLDYMPSSKVTYYIRKYITKNLGE